MPNLGFTVRPDYAAKPMQYRSARTLTGTTRRVSYTSVLVLAVSLAGLAFAVGMILSRWHFLS